MAEYTIDKIEYGGNVYKLQDNISGYIKNYTETDPVFSASAAAGIQSTDITNWNSKQAALVSGTNIKTVNGNSLLGDGDLPIGGSKNVWYGTCSTSPVTAAKVVTTISGDFTLEDGNAVIVCFESGNLATSQMTLDIDSIGAVNVDTASELCGVQYGTPVMFVYDKDVLAFIAVNRNKATATYYGLSKLPKVTQVSITVANWNATTTCTKSVTGVTTSNSIIVSPAPSSIADYVSAGVYCSAQGSGTLTFECTSTPTADLVVNVMIVG